MSSSETGPDESPSSPVESPGRALAAARESQSLSPADLAVRLRLDTRIVMALERDDFENLPAPTFIKGYIRSIAKELHIDAQAILDSYESQAAIEPPLADFSSRAPDQIGTNSTIIKAISYALAATLILLIALWWRSNYQIAETTLNAALEPEPESVAQTSPEPFNYPYEIVGDETEWELDPQETPALEEEVEDLVEMPTPDLVDSEPEPATTRQLLISTTDEAWIEVYDLNGSKLYYGLTRKEQPIEIDTETYYRLTLGNTDSISLHYNGEKIDLDPHSKDGVAHLELGAARSDAGEQ